MFKYYKMQILQATQGDRIVQFDTKSAQQEEGG